MFRLWRQQTKGSIQDAYLKRALRYWRSGIEDIHSLEEVLTTDLTLRQLGFSRWNLFNYDVRQEHLYQIKHLNSGTPRFSIPLERLQWIKEERYAIQVRVLRALDRVLSLIDGARRRALVKEMKAKGLLAIDGTSSSP